MFKLTQRVNAVKNAFTCFLQQKTIKDGERRDWSSDDEDYDGIIITFERRKAPINTVRRLAHQYRG